MGSVFVFFSLLKGILSFHEVLKRYPSVFSPEVGKLYMSPLGLEFTRDLFLWLWEIRIKYSSIWITSYIKSIPSPWTCSASDGRGVGYLDRKIGKPSLMRVHWAESWISEELSEPCSYLGVLPLGRGQNKHLCPGVKHPQRWRESKEAVLWPGGWDEKQHGMLTARQARSRRSL